MAVLTSGVALGTGLGTALGLALGSSVGVLLGVKVGSAVAVAVRLAVAAGVGVTPKPGVAEGETRIFVAAGSDSMPLHEVLNAKYKSIKTQRVAKRILEL